MTDPTPQDMIDCPMLRAVAGRPTDYWNDSCAPQELAYAAARGPTGATSNPSIGFIASDHELVGAIRDVVLPDPDVRQA